MARDDFRRKADAVREIPLEVVLAALGAQRDRRDRSQWRTEQGPITVTGPRFFNWHVEQGGGGAIDLAMHLRGCDAGEAIAWLTSHLGHHAPADQTTIRPRLSPTADASPSSPCVPRGPLRLPAANPSHLPRLKRYLIQQRALRLDLVDSLVDAGRLYADGRGNAVFVMVAGKPPRAIGAELRGTGTRVWRGLAPGTRRDAGYFWIGTQPAQKIVLCESAIDAISCFQLHGAPEREPHAHAHAQLHGPCICISTAGVRSDAPWLKPLLDRGYPLYCGFDNDDAGHAAASRMISRYPSIRRLIPPAHDWNDVLKANP
jgi:hypothetical protein